MQNWKTTIFGGISILLLCLHAMIPIIPDPWGPVVAAIAGVIAFYYAKDKNVTGVT
jgi:hypothetical protein